MDELARILAFAVQTLRGCGRRVIVFHGIEQLMSVFQFGMEISIEFANRVHA